MNKEEFVEKVMSHGLITKDEVRYGFELFTEDAENNLEMVTPYTHFCTLLVGIYDTEYQYDMHMLNIKYLDRIDPYNKDFTKAYSFLTFTEISYFCEFESYSEALTLIDKAIDMGDYFYPAYLASTLVYLYMINSRCGIYDDLQDIIERMERLLNHDAEISAYEYFLSLLLMEAYGILGNAEKSNSYYDFCIKYKVVPGFIENPVFNANVERLWLIAREKADTAPDNEYLKLFKETMNDIGCDCEVLNMHAYIITIFKYVRGYLPDDELKKYLISLIELVAAPRTKIELYEYLFSDFNYDKKSNPEFCEPYYSALIAHFRMSMDMQKHELTGILDKRKKLKEYRNYSEKDEMTGLGNRRAFDAIQKKYTDSQDIPDKMYIVSMDLNGLKEVNDKYGHLAGDEYICAAAEGIRKGFEGHGEAFRTGGDEFVGVLYTDASGTEEVISCIKELNKFWSGSHNQNLVISFGYANKNDISGDDAAHNVTFSEILALADKRMYANKKEYYEKIGYDRRNKF